MRIVARAPNHLGDGVMALPALHALARVEPFYLQAPPWGHMIYRDVQPAALRQRGFMGRPDVAVLFPPSLRAALHACAAKRVIGTDTDGRGLLLTDVVDGVGHRSDVYSRIVEVLGAEVSGPPVWKTRIWDPEPQVPVGHIGLNPISRSGAVVEWRGFRALADRLSKDHDVVFYGGPGEDAAVRTIAGPHHARVGLPLDAFGKALERCALFVSNDSGAAHFARAVGTATLVVYGSTDPAMTGPAGAHHLVGPEPDCWPCYRKRCEQAFECLDIPVDAVHTLVVELLRG